MTTNPPQMGTSRHESWLREIALSRALEHHARDGGVATAADVAATASAFLAFLKPSERDYAQGGIVGSGQSGVGAAIGGSPDLSKLMVDRMKAVVVGEPSTGGPGQRRVDAAIEDVPVDLVISVLNPVADLLRRLKQSHDD